MKDSNEGKHDDAGFASIRNPLFSLANVNKANNKDQAFKSNLDQIKMSSSDCNLSKLNLYPSKSNDLKTSNSKAITNTLKESQTINQVAPTSIDSSLQSLIEIFSQKLSSTQKQDLLKIAQNMISTPARPSGTFRVLKPNETMMNTKQNQQSDSSQGSENESNADDVEESKRDDTGQYEIIIRHVVEEASKVEEQETEVERNQIKVYSNALRDVCEENDLLRAEIIQSKRKTQKLELENEDMKEVIVELSESINYLTNGALNKRLSN